MRTITILCGAVAAGVMASQGRQATITMPTGGALASAAATAFVGWLVAIAAGFEGVVPVACGVLAGATPALARHRRREQASRQQARRWPDFLAAVRARLATGAALPAACAEAGRLLGGRFESLVGAPGAPFSSVVASARQAWSDPLADRVLTTLEVAQTAGGSQVSVVLAALAASLGDELRLRRAHEAALTEQRLTAGVALLAPWAILLLSNATNPAAAEAFDTPTGDLIVGGGLAATVIGYSLARRTARLSRPPRMFR